MGKPLGQPGTRCGWWGTSEEGSWEDGEDGVGGKGKRESWLGMDRARSEEESGGGGETGSAALHVGRATCVSLSRGRCEGRVGGELLQLLRLSGRRSVQDVGNIQHFARIFWDGADGETAFGRRRACDRIRGSIWAVADEVHSSVWVPCWFRRALIRRLGPYRPIQPPLFTSFVLPRHLPLFPPRALPSTTATTTTTIAPRRSLRVKLHPRPRQLNAKPVDDHPHPAQVAFPVLSLLPLPVSRSRSSSRTSPTRRMHILV